MKNRSQHYLIVIVHKLYVARSLFDLALGLMWRAITHDLSKFSSREVNAFSEHAPMLRVTRFGSPEYKRILTKMNAALTAHYGVNRHHPEHWKHGIHEMDIVDLTEMLCDWSAATRLSLKGDRLKSVDVGQERFHMGSVIGDVFRNTALFRWDLESRKKQKVAKWFLLISAILSTAYLIWGLFR